MPQTVARSRQGIPPNRESDAGPIPDPMLADLRRLLWSMETLPLYWAIGMGVLLGGVFIGGIILFATADAARQNHTTDAVGGLALAVLIAMAYSPFFNWWFEDKLEARWLREALYPQTLEDLAYYMAVCQMGSRKKVGARLLAIWKKHGLEPGWSARPMDPRPLFK